MDRSAPLAKAYRKLRHAPTLYRPKPPRALELARAALANVDRLADEYRTAQGEGADPHAIPIPADGPEAIKARSAYSQAKQAAGLYHSADDWPAHPEVADSLRDVLRADDVPSAHIRHKGWYTRPDGDVFNNGDGLCWGIIGRLSGKDGMDRYIAGYEFGGMDFGQHWDVSTVYTAPACGKYEMSEAAEEAARAADDMAEKAAEEERDYQTAYAAGSRWADLKDEEDEARKALRDILAERREMKARAGGNLKAICNALRDTVSRHLDTIYDNRRQRAELVAGDYLDYYFYPEPSLKDAFCEGAGLRAFPRNITH